MIDLGLAGKRALVAGAGYIPGRAGHGRASALRLAEAGASVVCVDIDRTRAEETAAAIRAAGGQAHHIVADMTRRDEAQRAVDETVSLLGGLDVCVDIIGRATWDFVDDITDEDWNWTFLNNLTHVFYLFQIAGRHFRSQGTGGALVAIASVDAIAAASNHAPYGAAKAGLISLVKSFADELGVVGVRVNAVAPGNVGSGNEDQPEGVYADNGINPLAAPRTRDVANGVLFLASELAARVTGHTLVVDGGATIHSLWELTGPPPG